MDAASALPQDLVFVDLETTGGDVARHRITEVGVVRIAQGKLVEEWSALVNPECAIPPYIESFTGITNAMVQDAPRFADIAAQVREKLAGAVFVAHNARFDYSFLRSEFRRLNMDFSAKVLCTVKLSRRLFPEFPKHNLDSVMQRHGLVCSARHRALGDARVLHDLWCKLCHELPADRLAPAIEALLNGPQLPPHLPADLADDLPEGPGVYRLFGEGDVLLRVGRSASLRTRVLRFFAPGDRHAAGGRLAAQIRRVDWSETAGELGAALLEGEWIKTQKPLHNRRAQSGATACTLLLRPATPHAAPPAAGAGRICAVPLDSLEMDALDRCFGVFQSEKDARKALRDIAIAKHLCLQVLGLEDGAGSCLAYQVGKCKGACVGKEPLMLHEARLQLALSSMKLKAWPFPGRIALRERAGTDVHVLDRWTYLGTARNDEELAVLSSQEMPVAFDADVYRILARYFANQTRFDWSLLAPRGAQSALRTAELS